LFDGNDNVDKLRNYFMIDIVHTITCHRDGFSKDINAAKASVKKILGKDDTKKDIQSAPSAVTGIRQLDIKGAVTLSEEFK
jgi:hypothetical protein